MNRALVNEVGNYHSAARVATGKAISILNVPDPVHRSGSRNGDHGKVRLGIAGLARIELPHEVEGCVVEKQTRCNSERTLQLRFGSH